MSAARLAEERDELRVVREADRRGERVLEVRALRRVVRIRVERESVHDRQGAATRPVGKPHRLDERRRGDGRAGCSGPVRPPGRRRPAPDVDVVPGRLDGVVGRRQQPEVCRRGHDLPLGPELVRPGRVAPEIAALFVLDEGDGRQVPHERLEPRLTDTASPDPEMDPDEVSARRAPGLPGGVGALHRPRAGG